MRTEDTVPDPATRRTRSSSPATALRWLAFAVLCVGVATAGWLLIEHQLTLWGRLVCPDGWWRSSPGNCAFPPVSISILAIGYAVVCVLLLATAVLAAPAHRLKTCVSIIIAFALWPVCTLVFYRFSWVAVATLCAVVGVAICFALGAFVMRVATSNGMPPPETKSLPTSLL